MNILKKNEYQYDTYNSKWKEIIWYNNLKYLKEVKKDLEAIKVFIDTDFKDLPNEYFYNLMTRFYTFKITKSDILKILSEINGIKYDKFEKLNSKMIFKSIVSEGHGKDLSWWEETFQKCWIVAVSKNVMLNPNYNYSKSEIKEMIKNNQIIAFSEFSKPANINSSSSYESEKVEDIKIPKIDLECKDYEILLHDFNTSFDFSLLRKDKSELNKEIYINFIKMIRKRLNKKKVLNDCKEIILFLNDNIHLIDKIIQPNLSFDKEINGDYLNLQKDLTDIHKTLIRKLI